MRLRRGHLQPTPPGMAQQAVDKYSTSVPKIEMLECKNDLISRLFVMIGYCRGFPSRRVSSIPATTPMVEMRMTLLFSGCHARPPSPPACCPPYYRSTRAPLRGTLELPTLGMQVFTLIAMTSHYVYVQATRHRNHASQPKSQERIIAKDCDRGWMGKDGVRQ